MSLREDTIRLAHANPALRPHLLPLLDGKTADIGIGMGRDYAGHLREVNRDLTQLELAFLRLRGSLTQMADWSQDYNGPLADKLRNSAKFVEVQDALTSIRRLVR